MRKSNKIFLIAGRTGGPIIPLLAIFRSLEKIQQKEILEIEFLIEELTKKILEIEPVNSKLENILNTQNLESGLRSNLGKKLEAENSDKINYSKISSPINFLTALEKPKNIVKSVAKTNSKITNEITNEIANQTANQTETENGQKQIQKKSQLKKILAKNSEIRNSEIDAKLSLNSLEKFEKLEKMQKKVEFKIANQFTGLIIGVKNGFEVKLATQENLAIEFLPEAKLEILSFRLNLRNWVDFWEFLTNFGKFLQTITLLIWSFGLSFWLIFKHRPVAILSSGSFLAIPVIWAAWLVNLVNSFFHFFPKIKLITHGQDPLPGIASRLTIGFGHLQSCVFDYSKKFSNFKNTEIIPNPLNFAKFASPKTEIVKVLQKNPKFSEFLKPSLSKIDE